MLVHSDVSDFGIGVSAPRNRERAGLLAAEEERVLNDDASQGIRHVRELEARAYIARGVNVRIGRSQSVINANALFRVEVDAGGLEAHVFDIWQATSADKDSIDDDIRPALDPQCLACSALLDAEYLGPSQNLDPIAPQRRFDNRGRVSVFFGENLRQRF
jgi:hypothetical protein